MTQPQSLRYPIIPVQVLRVNGQEVPRREWVPWRVEYIQRLMNQFTELAEALVDGSNIGRLLARTL